MLHAIEKLIAQYGVIAVFLGCLAEGEAAAIVGGFFARSAILPLWQGLLAAMLGTYLANMLLFIAGRHMAAWPFIVRLREKPGFSHALELAGQRPRAFVFFNRFVYGMRLVGGAATGLAGVPWRLFLIWNFISAVVWAALFVGIGYFFGLGAEALVGRALHTHQRLVVGVGILVAATVAGLVIARRVKRREARLTSREPPPRDEGPKE